ncbi:MAG: IS66 family insertion sequence element accessory protein TnpA [Bacteroidota bacterium]
MQNKSEIREQMMGMIANWQESGLTQRAFCSTNHIAYHVFHYWYGVYRANKSDTGSFLPVKVTSAVIKEQITITGVSGIQVQIPLSEQSIGFVKQLLLS